MAKIAIIIGVAAVAISALAFIAHYDMKALAAAAGSLILVIAALAGLMLSISALTTDIFQKSRVLEAMGIIVLVLGGVSGVLILLDKIASGDGEKMLRVAESLSMTMAAIGLAMVEIAAAGVVATGAVAALGPIGIAVGLILALLTTISAIVTSMGVTDEQLDQFVKTSEKIGSAIGGFAGNLIGGLAGGALEGIVSRLPEIGLNLWTFAKNIQPMFNLHVPEEFGDVLTAIGDIFKLLAKESFASNSMASSTKDITRMKNFFTGLGEAITALSKSAEGMNRSRVQTIAEVTAALAELSGSMGSKQSLWGLIAGNQYTLKDFAKHLKAFGEGLVEFGNSLNGWNQFVVMDKLPAIKELLDLQVGLGDTHSLIGWIVGQKQNLGDLGSNISNFGSGLRIFSDQMHLFDPSTVDVAKSVTETFTELEKGLNASPSLMGYITGGNQSLGDFGHRISDFAIGLRLGLNSLRKLGDTDISDFSDLENKGIPTSAIDGMKEAARNDWFTSTSAIIDKAILIAEKFSDLESAIGESGSIANGKSNLEAFSAGITAFGAGMKDFTKDFPTNIPELEEVQKLIDIGNMFKVMAIDSGQLAQAGDGATVAGNFANSFVSGVTGVLDSVKSGVSSFVSTDGEETGGGLMNSIVSLFKNEEINTQVTEGGTETATSYLSALDEVFSVKSKPMDAAKKAFDNAAQTLMKFFEFVGGNEGGESYYDRFFSLGQDYIQGLIDGMESLHSAATDKAREIALDVEEAYANAQESHSPSRVAYRLGSYFVWGLAQGLSESASEAVNSASDMAVLISDAVQSALDASNDVIEDELSPMITPVLDTSNIQQGAHAISSMLNNKQAYNAILGIEQSRVLAANYQNSEVPTGNTINISFNVDNVGGELTEADISRYSKQIADEVNIRLGKMFRR